MADLIEEVLQRVGAQEKQFKSIQVDKDIELEIDLGNLLAVDNNNLDIKQFKSNREEYLKFLARDNTQLLLNKVWELPAERKDEAVVVTLPKPTTRIPREKPIPKPSQLTRWQEYAKQKGIQQKKKSTMMWDEEHKEFRPRFGYRKANDESKDWLAPVKQYSDPYENPFLKKKEQKNERIAKNEYQRLKNIARANKMPAILPTDNPSKQQLTKAIANARVATASAGSFVQDVAHEKPHMKRMGKKRKFEPAVSNFDKEKRKNLEIYDRVRSKVPKINADKAATREMHRENVERSKEKSQNPKKNKKGGGKSSGKSKGKGGKGKGKRVMQPKQGMKRGKAKNRRV